MVTDYNHAYEKPVFRAAEPMTVLALIGELQELVNRKPETAGWFVHILDMDDGDEAPEDKCLALYCIQDFGGLLRCTVCGREEPLGNIAGNLRNGWPRRHDLTMRWWTQRQLDAGEDRG